MDRSVDVDRLRELVPRVRTIALGTLFVREDPHDLPYIAKLIGDQTTTMPDLHESMRATPPIPPVLSEEIEGLQTVGQVACAMIQFYLEATHPQLAVRGCACVLAKRLPVSQASPSRLSR